MSQLPNTVGFVRIKDLVGGTNPPLPITRNTLYQWIKQGRIPAPRRIGPRVVAWPADQAREMLTNLGAEPSSSVTQLCNKIRAERVELGLREPEAAVL